MNICVIGLGFVGLTTALGFADKGMSVFGYDINAEHSNKIANGIVPYYEPGLQEALSRNLGSSFAVTKNVDEITSKPDTVFICVGTPCDDTGKADLTHVKSAIDSVSKIISKKCVIVIKSTVPPGTTRNEIIPYVRSLGLNNPIAVNPEFLREGWCWQDFTNPDRIVCGISDNDEDTVEILKKIYSPFNAPIHFVSYNTAEFIKYLSNCLLANLVSFSNEMALIAQATGEINIGKAFKVLHEDSRLRNSGISHYIYPGCGYGGYCLPKDTVAFLQNAEEQDIEPKILREVIHLNDNMPGLTAKKIISATKNNTDKIGIFGLSFKPNSDDVRDSPAAKIINVLISKSYKSIFVYDPVSNENFKQAYNLPVTYCSSKEELCRICSVAAIVTIWQEFKDINKKYPDVTWVDCRYFLADS